MMVFVADLKEAKEWGVCTSEKSPQTKSPFMHEREIKKSQKKKSRKGERRKVSECYPRVLTKGSERFCMSYKYREPTKS